MSLNGTIFCLAALALAGGTPVCAEEKGLGAVAVWMENDSFATTDSYYSHATRLSLEYDNGYAPPWLPGSEWIANTSDLKARPGETFQYDLHLAQHIYTGTNIQNEEPPEGDRPYAGWLYLGSSYTVTDERSEKTWTLSLGVIGPSSLARQTQEQIHAITGSEPPKGWKYQLQDEPAIDLLHEQAWKIPALSALDGDQDGLLTECTFNANLGTTFVHTGAGVMTRAGWGLNGFGLSPFRLSDGNVIPKMQHPRHYSFEIFATAQGRVVGRNAFLDGNLFHDSRSVDKEPLVGDLILGTQIRAYAVEIGYMVINRSKEFKGQPEAETFGSIGFDVSF